MASSNPIFKDEDLATLEEEMEKAAALAKAARRAMNLNIFSWIQRVKKYAVLCECIQDIQVIQVEVVVMTMQQPLHI